MSRLGKKIWLVLLTGALFCSALPISAQPETQEAAGEAGAVQVQQADSYSKRTYEEYLSSCPTDARPDASVVIEGVAYTHATAQTQVVTAEDALTHEKRTGLHTGDTGEVTWEFEVAAAGLYMLSVSYYNEPGTGNDMERSLYIDGEIPYTDAGNLVFTRTWRDKGEKEYSGLGNEIRRSQEEVPVWSQTLLRATTGYHDDDLLFYLAEGTHTLTLRSVREPMVIGRLTFWNPEEEAAYAEVRQSWQEQGIGAADPAMSGKVQGEDASLKSAATLYAVENRSSPLNEPYDLGKILLNCIGGTTWKYQGAWIEWEIDVPQTGLYQLVIRAKQNYSSGVAYTKTLTVDGQIPYQEARNLAFRYSPDWQLVSPETQDGEACLLYLTEGTHTLRLTNTLGDLGTLLRQVEDSSQVLSDLYRRVRMVVGTTVDTNRDYQLEDYISDLMTVLEEQHAAFERYIAEMEALAGNAGEQTVTLQQVLTQLEYYLNNEKRIPSKISGLSDSLSSLATWITTVTEQSVLIDYLALIPPGGELPEADAGFFAKAWNEIRSFLYSFVSDYSLIESSGGAAGSDVTLWLSNAVGRDQANIIKQLAEGTFTQDTGYRLEIQLVDMSVLLRAVAAGDGPDVGIYQDQATPINYGVRSALQDLTVFEDLDEVLARFDDGAVIPFSFNGRVYALPETENFLMMFIRTDIFDSLGLEPPQTWEELYDIIPVLNRSYYEVSLPTPVTVESGSSSTDINSIYAALLLQAGGSVYNADGSRCVLNSRVAVDSFVTWAELYTKYMIPKTTDAITYFRTGTAPIVFSNLNFYNSLAVGAPEIRGMWDMYLIPGTRDENGEIRRNMSATMTGCLMYANAADKQASWEFLKWWTSADIQSRYGAEIEALQGKSGRWMTANLEAMSTIGWSSEELAKIREGLSWAEGIPEVAGGYYVGRSVDNAIKSVINSGTIPRETLLDYVDDINYEIISKRTELGLE